MADVLIEARLLHPETETETERDGGGEGEGGGGGGGGGRVGAEVPSFDGAVVEKLLGKQGFGRVVAVGEM